MFTLPSLPYDYNSLEPFIDEETMHVHHDGHHATYVKNLNDALKGYEQFLNMGVEELLKSLDQVPKQIRNKVKNNAGGHYHHSLFWTMMTPNQTEPDGKLLEEINKTFGSLEDFKEQFNTSCLQVFGSGWTWLVWENGKLAIVNTPNQDSPISQNQFPLLGIDLWEHAYYLKYKNKRADFIQEWWQVASWQEAEKRFLSASTSKINY